MKISSRLIIKVAMQLLEEDGKIVHIELHKRIEETLGRRLTINDKRRCLHDAEHSIFRGGIHSSCENKI